MSQVFQQEGQQRCLCALAARIVHWASTLLRTHQFSCFPSMPIMISSHHLHPMFKLNPEWGRIWGVDEGHEPLLEVVDRPVLGGLHDQRAFAGTGAAGYQGSQRVPTAGPTSLNDGYSLTEDVQCLCFFCLFHWESTWTVPKQQWYVLTTIFGKTII